MPNFRVKYSFKCKVCENFNDRTMDVGAPDKVAATQLTHKSAACSECNSPIDPQQPFTTAIERI
jgi:hypothetical protein